MKLSSRVKLGGVAISGDGDPLIPATIMDAFEAPEGESCASSHWPEVRFRFHVSQGEVQKCLRHGVMHKPLMKTAVVTAAIVGTVLTSINQGNVLLAGRFPPTLYWKVPLTYAVPYCVSIVSALRISLSRDVRAARWTGPGRSTTGR